MKKPSNYRQGAISKHYYYLHLFGHHIETWQTKTVIAMGLYYSGPIKWMQK